MPQPAPDRIPSKDRLTADRLRAIKGSLRSLGKRGLADVFAAGEVLEEASTLLDGTFSTWVKSECGIEPRTALGYRKTFRLLRPHQELRAERGVAPSVAIAIAAAGESPACDALCISALLPVTPTIRSEIEAT